MQFQSFNLITVTNSMCIMYS